MAALRTIGILGGMGPQATVLLMQKLIDAIPAEDDSGHIPLIVDSNTQVPSRIAHLIEGTGADPAPVLVAMARRLEASGAKALAMPCNTAHHYAAKIAGAVGIPFLSMTDAACRAARRMGSAGTRIGLLASPAVRATGVFDSPLAKAGLEPLYPTHQDALLAAIRSIKRVGVTADAREALRDASAELVSAGAAIQLVACTELSLIAEAVDPAAIVVDTLDALVEEIVSFAGGETREVHTHRKAG